jgi:hypothetical protein
MKIWVQSKKNNPGVPLNISQAIALDGFIQRGHWSEFFSVEEIDQIHWRREEPLIGGVGTYQRVLPKLGVQWERRSYPDSLSDFMGRQVGYIKMHDLSRFIESRGRSVFIKPANDDKGFTGFVCNHPEDRWNPKLSKMADDAMLVWSDVITIKTEYRVYVLNGNIQNIARYRGEVEFLPNIRVIRDMIEAYTDAPISYGLDVAVEQDRQTCLVEVNESLALGNYGLPSMLHAKMIAARWFELMGDHSRMSDESDSVDSPPFLNTFTT